MNRLSRHFALLFIPIALACFALAPQARATCQEGCLTNANTVLGDDALLNNTALDNTAIGFEALEFNTTGNNNTAIGFNALLSNTHGAGNTAIGYQALFSNTDGIGNTATGFAALYSNTDGAFNTATGDLALFSNTTGYDNTAYGTSALYGNTTGLANTATGHFALNYNTTGTENTAMGWYCLSFNSTGLSNTAVGSVALENNSTGSNNTAVGVSALMGLGGVVTGDGNTATGVEALLYNTRGNDNTADGSEALGHNQIGDSNTATGVGALSQNTGGNNNTATGVQALLRNTTGHSNIALGFAAGKNLTVGSNNIDVGNKGVAAESNTIRIGTTGTQTNAYMAGISGATLPTGVAVIIDTDGHLGTVTSSARFKEHIQPMDKASETILALKPVTFRYKHELDPDGIPQFGLVAEEVEKANPDLVARDDQGKPYTVRYEAVNAMLLNEFLKEHKAFVEEQRKVQEQGATIARLEKQVQLLIAGLQKVNAQLETSKPAPQVVNNP